MTLVDQWHALEADLPVGWEDVRLTLTVEHATDLPRAARFLGSINAGRVGESLVLHVGSGVGPEGKQNVLRVFGRLDRERIWCQIEKSAVEMSPAAPAAPSSEPPRLSASVAESWDRALAPLPSDWSDLLCELQVESSTLLDRVALLCAPLNPARSGSRLVFTFRCSGRSGYGVSPAMARRCFERLDAEGIVGTTTVLRVLSETDNVDTQGPVWLVGGKTL